MRVVLLLAIVAAAGLGVWLALGEDETPHASAGLGEGSEDATSVAAHNPILVAPSSMPSQGEAESLFGAPWSVEVEVLDEKGSPAPAMLVRLRHKSYPWASRTADPERMRAWHAQTLRRSYSIIERESEPAWIAEGTTDARGVLVLRGRGEGEFEVETAPSEVRLCSHAAFNVAVNLNAPSRVVLRLLAAHAVVGRVVDDAGRGVVASLDPRVGGHSDAIAWRGRRTACRADGSFTFLAPAGRMHVGAVVSGRGSTNHGPFDVPSKAPLELVVPAAAGTLRVIVENEDGAPVAGAVVAAVVVEAPHATWFAETGADGVAAIHSSAGLLRSLRVERPPWRALDQRHPAVAWRGLRVPTSGQVEVRLVLQHGGSIHGIVRDGPGGPGLAGATVHALPGGRDAGGSYVVPARATTDEAGRYRLDGLPLGVHLLLAEHPLRFHPDLEHARGAEEPPPGMLAVLLAAGGELERDLVMSQGVQVAGRVVGGNGVPVARASVVAPRSDSRMRALARWQIQVAYDDRHLAETDEQGNFAVVLAPERSIRLGAYKGELVGKYSTPISTAVGSVPAEVVLVVEQCAELRGRVLRSSDRTPIVGAHVTVWPQDREVWAAAALLNVRTDAEGRFEVLAAPPCALAVQCRSPGAIGKSLVLPAIESGADREELELLLDEGSEVMLRLVGKDDGLPIAGAIVLLEQRGSRVGLRSSDGAGLLPFEDLPPGPISVRVRQSDGSVAPPIHEFVAPAVGVVEVRYAAPAEHVLEGRVLGPDGELVPLCSVGAESTVRGRQGGAFASEVSAHTAIGGRFALVVLGQPPFALRVTSARDAAGVPLPYQDRRVAVSADELLAGPLEIRLEAEVEIRVRLVDEAGQPIPRAAVSLVGWSGSRLTGPDGRAVFAVVSPDDTRVRVAAKGWTVADEGYPLLAGGEETTIALLPDGTSIRGRATALPASASPWKVACVPSHDKQIPVQAKVESDGSFQLNHLAVDTLWDLLLTCENATRYALATAVESGNMDVELHLVDGGTIGGRVEDIDPSIRGDSRIQYVHERGFLFYAKLDREGTFVRHGLPPGTYTISCVGAVHAPPRSGVATGTRGVRLQARR